MENNETKFVKIHDVKIDREHVQWLMKQWYLFYSSSAEKLAQIAREIQPSGNQTKTKLVQIARVPEDKGEKTRTGAYFPEIFAYVPWGTIPKLSHCRLRLGKAKKFAFLSACS